MKMNERGFTLLELMITVVVLGILVAIAIPKYTSMVVKSKEGATRGNLSSIRSAISIYYGDNEQYYPFDNLTTLVTDTRYIPIIPLMKTPPFHEETVLVTAESVPTDIGTWSYDNDNSTTNFGWVVVGCLHSDLSGNVWSSY